MLLQEVHFPYILELLKLLSEYQKDFVFKTRALHKTARFICLHYGKSHLIVDNIQDYEKDCVRINEKIKDSLKHYDEKRGNFKELLAQIINKEFLPIDDERKVLKSQNSNPDKHGRNAPFCVCDFNFFEISKR